MVDQLLLLLLAMSHNVRANGRYRQCHGDIETDSLARAECKEF